MYKRKKKEWKLNMEKKVSLRLVEKALKGNVV